MKQADADRINENYAVYAAMVKAGFKTKPKLKPAEYARRFAREAVLQQRRYCDAFALWRTCRDRRCRRRARCCGYVSDCLKRAVRTLPQQVQVQARQDLFKGTPRNIGAPERQARQFMPREFYE